MWITENESSKFWLSVLTELQQRGVKDIFIACVDGLTGFPAAIETVFPKTTVQLCIVHMVCNSFKLDIVLQKRTLSKICYTVYCAFVSSFWRCLLFNSQY